MAKNWTFPGKVYIKKTTEGEAIEVTKKEDLIPYDVKKMKYKYIYKPDMD